MRHTQRSRPSAIGIAFAFLASSVIALNAAAASRPSGTNYVAKRGGGTNLAIAGGHRRGAPAVPSRPERHGDERRPDRRAAGRGHLHRRPGRDRFRPGDHPELRRHQHPHRPEHRRCHLDRQHGARGSRPRVAGSRVHDVRRRGPGVRLHLLDGAGRGVPVRLRVRGVQRVGRHSVQRRVRVLPERREHRGGARRVQRRRIAGLDQQRELREPLRRRGTELQLLPQQRPSRTAGAPSTPSWTA